jgi:ribonuclease VapC
VFVDASALLAILLLEPEAQEFAQLLRAAPHRSTSPIAIFETVTGLMRSRKMSRTATEEHVNALLATAEIDVIPITENIGRLALEAFDRYGKGRGHPARLNLGDCFAYACAKARGEPLLYKGDDFGLTDLATLTPPPPGKR